MHRRSRAVRLTLLPLLASASLAKAQAWPGNDCPPYDPDCRGPCAPAYGQAPDQYQSQYQVDPNAYPAYPYDWYDYWYDPVYVVVPVQRQGFGSYFWIGTAG
jgi:hypothetical protein